MNDSLCSERCRWAVEYDHFRYGYKGWHWQVEVGPIAQTSAEGIWFLPDVDMRRVSREEQKSYARTKWEQRLRADHEWWERGPIAEGFDEDVERARLRPV